MDNVDLLQQLMDNIGDNIFFKDRDGKFIMINKANAEWFGLEDPREAVGKDDFDFFTEEHALIQREEEQWIMDTGQPVLCEEQGDDRDGFSVGWGSVTKMPLRDKDGNIIGTMGIGRDITELKSKEQKLKQAHEQMAEDLRMAAKLQQTFLPQNYPSFTGADGRPLIQFHHYYEADVELGGDFCAIYRLSNSKAGMLICDVMGHGVRAALVTGIIYTIADDLVEQADSPGDFLTALNRRLTPVLQTGGEYLFATAAYFTIDVDNGELAGAVAGHPLPFLIQPAGGQVSQIEADQEQRGPALAVMQDYAYQSLRIQLHAGEEILMFTDGIYEALNTSSTEFGEEHLRDTIQSYKNLPLQDLIARIVNTVQNHAGRKKLGDDICLLGFTLNALRTAEPG